MQFSKFHLVLCIATWIHLITMQYSIYRGLIILDRQTLMRVSQSLIVFQIYPTIQAVNTVRRKITKIFFINLKTIGKTCPKYMGGSRPSTGALPTTAVSLFYLSSSYLWVVFLGDHQGPPSSSTKQSPNPNDP